MYNIPDRSMSPPEPKFSGVCCDRCDYDIPIGCEFYWCENGEIVCGDCQDYSTNCVGCDSYCRPEIMDKTTAMEIGLGI